MKFDEFSENALKVWKDPSVIKSPEEIADAGRKEIFTDFDKKFWRKQKMMAALRKAPLVGPDGGPGEVTRVGGQGLSDAPPPKPRAQPFMGQFPNSPLGANDVADDVLPMASDINDNSIYMGIREGQQAKADRLRDKIEQLIGYEPTDDESDEFLDWEERKDDFIWNRGAEIEQDGMPWNLNYAFGGVADATPREALLRYYTENGAFDINHYLRKGELDEDTDPQEMQEIITEILFAMRDQYPGDLYRGLDKDIFKSLKVGDIIRDPGFMSTSLDKEIPLHVFGGAIGALMKISGARGHVVDLSTDSFLNDNNDENEVIIKPNQLLRYMGNKNDEYLFDAIYKDDYDEDEWAKIMKRQDEDGYDLEESKSQLKKRLTQAFRDRMNDFQFEVLRQPTKKFEEFNADNK